MGADYRSVFSGLEVVGRVDVAGVAAIAELHGGKSRRPAAVVIDENVIGFDI